MILRSLPILLLNLVLIAIALLLTYNIITHYDDGGCDGGACAILFFIHTLPMLLTWVLLIAGLNFALHGKMVSFLFVVPAIAINTAIYWLLWDVMEMLWYNNVLYVLAGACIGTYFYVRKKNMHAAE